jgi:hypothetical protein
MTSNDKEWLMNRAEVSEQRWTSRPTIGARRRPILLPVALAMLALTACDRRDPSVGSTPAPSNTAAPTSQYPAPGSSAAGSSAPRSSDMTDPSKGPGTEVTEKGGTETGMVGGASGTTASGGKPGSGTEAGAGTGAAQSSTSKEETKEK